jgi:SAM-dependent methyltransferase
MPKIKKYSLPHWIKQSLQFQSNPQNIISAALARHFESPDESPIAFDGSPLELINALYLEWKKRESVYHCFFPTPLAAARDLAQLATIGPDDVVFDPGCGFGNLLHAAQECGARAFGCDLQEWLSRQVAPVVGLDLQRGDFLDGYELPQPFTAVLMNPPFGKGYSERLGDVSDLTAAFLDRVNDLAAPGTRVAAILPANFLDSERPKYRCEVIQKLVVKQRVRLPGDTFKPLTSVATEMVLLQATGKPRRAERCAAPICAAPISISSNCYHDLPLFAAR